MELLPWDCWGIIESPELDVPEDLTFLDQLAELTCGDVSDFKTVQHLYESEARLRMDGTLHSYIDGRMETVKITLA
jgi:hypothetical protein